MDDNHVDLSLPFKGPFKGKGQNRKAAHALRDEYTLILKEMERVVALFHETFPQPRPINLSIHRRSKYHVLLSWRYAVHGGSYLHLFGNVNGEKLLAGLGPNTVRRFAELDRIRLELNFRSKIVYTGIQAYQLFLKGLEAEVAWFNGRSRNPIQRAG
jgi:hypothetical protein